MLRKILAECAWGVLIAFFLVLGLALGNAIFSGCNSSDEPAPKGISEACIRSFAPTLREYEAAVGHRVADACRFLDRDYNIVLLDRELEVLCGEQLAENEQLAGCTHSGTTKTIYLNSSRSLLQQVDSSVHEWFHAILACDQSNPDSYHLSGRIWMVYGTKTAEANAIVEATNVEIASCL